jgi:plastocyanin
MTISKLHHIILAGCLLPTAFCFPAFAQGGTGKLPPIRKLPPPIRNPPPRTNPDGLGTNSGPGYTATIDKVALNRGTIAGDISYRGPAPRRVRIDTSADPVCRQLDPRFEIEEPLVRQGKLANVFVYIKDGVTANGEKLNELSFPSPEKQVVHLDQKNCVFSPHVLGVMVKQPITVTNSDPTTHNVHFVPKLNPDWNMSQPNGAAPISHHFDRAEIMVRVKDNQHPWKRAYVGVLSHPFFVVTGEDGRFEIRGLPPGKYTLAAWREGPGNGTEITLTVTVK